MTKEFLNSAWGTFKFLATIKAVSIDRNKRLIIIVYPEADDFTKLDTEIKKKYDEI